MVGAAYSLPPVRLKRYPLAAALCISGVRSAVVNLGMYGHFALVFGGALTIAPSVWALTAFVLPFSFAIAVLKDVPDMEGDRRYRIATFTVRLGPRRAARLGIGALVLAYAGMIVLGPLLVDDAQPVVLAATNAAVLVRSSPSRGAPTPPIRARSRVLHARLGAVLPRIRARRGGCARGKRFLNDRLDHWV